MRATHIFCETLPREAAQVAWYGREDVIGTGNSCPCSFSTRFFLSKKSEMEVVNIIRVNFTVHHGIMRVTSMRDFSNAVFFQRLGVREHIYVQGPQQSRYFLRLLQGGLCKRRSEADATSIFFGFFKFDTWYVYVYSMRVDQEGRKTSWRSLLATKMKADAYRSWRGGGRRACVVIGRGSELRYAGTEHVGFSPTQADIACTRARNAVRCSASYA